MTAPSTTRRLGALVPATRLPVRSSDFHGPPSFVRSHQEPHDVGRLLLGLLRPPGPGRFEVGPPRLDNPVVPLGVLPDQDQPTVRVLELSARKEGRPPCHNTR